MEQSNKALPTLTALTACLLLAVIFITGNSISTHILTQTIPPISPNTQLAQVIAPSNGLVGYWTFDEGSGTVANDTSGSGNNGTLVNSPTWVTGVNAKVGNGAIQFDGTNKTVSLGDPANSSLDFGTGSFSYGMWVYINANVGSWDMSWYKGGSSFSTPGYDMELGNNEWLANLNDGTNAQNLVLSTTPLLNQWTHLFVVIDRSTQKAYTYLNGAIVNSAGTDISNIGSLSTTIPAHISGADDGRYNLDGKVDDVRIYNRALSAAEVNQLYNYTGVTVTPPATPPAACTSFTYSDWSTCTNDSQSRTITSSSPSGCTGGTPVLTQGCTVTQTTPTETYYVATSSQSISTSPTAIPVSSGNTYYVSDSAGSDNNTGTSLSPFKTIQKAYNAALPGDTIIVKPGVYKELYSSTDGIGILLNKNGSAGKPITIRSEVKWQAILDGQNITNHKTMVFISGSFNIVDGFEIRNGWLEGVAIYSYAGGGNYNQIINNNIHNNGNIGDPASAYGQDGIYDDSGTHDNKYVGNYIHHNGRIGGAKGSNDQGLYISGDNEFIANNIVTFNAGWGIQIAGYTTSTNYKIYNNTSAWNYTGGLILWRGLDGIDIKNNIFSDNTGWGIDSYDAHGRGVVFDHNLFYGNSSGAMDYTEGGLKSDYTYILGTNILAQSPNFVADTTDYRLNSGSPAINAGLSLSDVPTDFDGVPRPQVGSYDIGAYEYVGAVTYKTGDFNHDGSVNTLDFSAMRVYWNQNNATYDLNSDGIVNSLDFSIMAQHWTG